MSRKIVRGIAVFPEFGEVHFQQKNSKTVVIIDLSNLPKNKKLGFHIHEAGDLRDLGGKKCHGACSHYNPHGKTHGSLNSKIRHVGDLGNIITDSSGKSKMTMETKLKLSGKYSVIGRSVVIHAKEDDLGLGGNQESLKTGNAGSRIGCAVIGYSMNSKLYF